MLRGFFGNLIFAIIARMLCGNHLNHLHNSAEPSGQRKWLRWDLENDICRKVTKMGSIIQCFRSCDQNPYLHNETKRGICIKIEFNPQKNISLLQDGRRSVCLLLRHGRRDVMWTHSIGHSRTYCNGVAAHTQQKLTQVPPPGIYYVYDVSSLPVCSSLRRKYVYSKAVKRKHMG